MSWKDEYDGLVPNEAGSIGQEIKVKEQANKQPTGIERRSNNR